MFRYIYGLLVIFFYYHSWVDASTDGLLVPCPVVGVSAHTWINIFFNLVINIYIYTVVSVSAQTLFIIFFNPIVVRVAAKKWFIIAIF